MVQVNDLAKSFKRQNGETVFAVKGVSFTIGKGEIFSLLGPNGAGKTTTISMISGLLTPTRGDATIGGYSITKQPLQAKNLLGVVPQEIALYLALSARQNLEFFGKMYGLGGAELKKRVDEVLDFIDLTDRQHDKVETFSGGMKRRVNIGVGLLHRPQLIYMDEPTVGIDPQNRRRVLDTVLRLRQEMGMTVLYTSHLMEEVQEISDRVAIVDHGEIIAVGTVGELIQKIGEEDRLIFNVGAQLVPETLLRKITAEIPGVTTAEYQRHDIPEGTVTDSLEIGSGEIVVMAKRGRKALPQIIQMADEAGINVVSVSVREPDLEAVFLALTGRALRD
ncbi:MAG: ABC transporter ATP-binding protein [Chloroflexi bacterium]|uniref:ABC transporter ATP-binding protein n=1 Tax=Candidatus Flexifilum breve TaxID=3140694 RepID=UPI003134A98E|nr:ABC transporter ATP-binding protein [Chloroflexota bacterium]